MGALVSVNVGLPKDVPWQGRTVHTGIWKTPVSGPVMARKLNLDGDGQGDLGGHGGEQRAVMVYQVESYDYWRSLLGRNDLEPGHFGENFTITGHSDAEVCIGDRYRIGDAEFEVSQPRVTCFRIGLRLGLPEMPNLLVAHHRPGFYLRVLTEGHVQAGDEIVLLERGPHQLSVADVDALLYLPDRDDGRLHAAVDIPALSPGWQQSFRELISGTTPSGPDWTGFRRLRVAAVRAETGDVSSVELVSADGTPLPPAAPGQYLTIRAEGAPAPVRSYSISRTTDDGSYRISVKREPRGIVSTWVHEHLKPGTTLEVAAPRGEFQLLDTDSPVILLSAGIGITPVLAMLHALADEPARREVWWIHIARDAAHHPFQAEVDELITRLPRAHVNVFYTSETGRLQASSLRALSLPADAEAYVCGPESFMAAMQDALTAVGIAPACIHTERFGTRSAINPGVNAAPVRPPHLPDGLPGNGPPVTFARSGITVPWSTRYASLLDLAEDCDVPTRFSCRSGVCHMCVTPVLDGSISYAPPPLELPESGTVLICCAEPATQLVLDL